MRLKSQIVGLFYVSVKQFQFLQLKYKLLFLTCHVLQCWNKNVGVFVSTDFNLLPAVWDGVTMVPLNIHYDSVIELRYFVECSGSGHLVDVWDEFSFSGGEHLLVVGPHLALDGEQKNLQVSFLRKPTDKHTAISWVAV